MAWFADKLIAAVGGDYTTLAAFEAAYDGVDISATDGVRARIKGTTSDSGDIAFASWQAGQSVSCKIVITAETGYGLQDRVGWTGADGSGDDAIIPQVLRFAEPTNPLYIDIYNLEIIKRIQWYQCIGGVIRVWNGLVRDTAANLIYFTANCGTTTAYLANLLARDLGLGYGAVTCSDADVTVYAWHITHDVSGYGYYCDAGAMQLRNSIGVNVTNGAIAANVTDNDYCAADDTTPDNSGIDNIVEADNFTDIVGEDYTVKDTGADIYHAGTDQPAWFDALTGGKDIRGVAWHATTPSMGCFEYEEAGGAYTLTASTGSFSLTGTASDLKADRKVSAAVGEFSLSGIDAGLRADRKLPASAGSFILTGIDVTLTYTPSGTYVLSASVGSFSLTGIDVGLRTTRKLPIETGSFAFTGIDAGLYAQRKLISEADVFILTGIDADLRTTRQLSASVGTFTLTGTDAALLQAAKLPTTVGEFGLTGIAVNLLRAAKISASVGVFVLTGKPVTLTYSGALYRRYVLNSSPRHKYLLTSHAGHKYFLKSGPKTRINLNSSPYWRR